MLPIFQPSHLFQVVDLNINWDRQTVMMFRETVMKIIIDYANLELEIWQTQPQDEPKLHLMIKDMIQTPVREIKIGVVNKNNGNFDYNISLYGCTLKQHQLRFDYFMSNEALRHYLFFKFSDWGIEHG